MPRYIALFLTLILLCAAGAAFADDEEFSPVGRWYAASAQISGEYVNARSLFGDMQLEILEDGSCVLIQNGKSFYGTWKLQYGAAVLSISGAEYEAGFTRSALYMSVDGIPVTFLSEAAQDAAESFDESAAEDFCGTWYLNYMDHYAERMPIRSSDPETQSDVVLLEDGTAEFYTAGELTGSYRWSYAENAVLFLLEEDGRLIERTAGLIAGELVMQMSEDVLMIYGREEVLADIE